jgi:hypothetical protein
MKEVSASLITIHLEFEVYDPEMEGVLDTKEKAMLWLYAFILMLVAAFMSGNTVGLAAISRLDLELKQEVGTKEEKRQANKISRVINNHHWMLCTLLILNAAALESLPIVLEKLMSP